MLWTWNDDKCTPDRKLDLESLPTFRLDAPTLLRAKHWQVCLSFQDPRCLPGVVPGEHDSCTSVGETEKPESLQRCGHLYVHTTKQHTALIARAQREPHCTDTYRRVGYFGGLHDTFPDFSRTSLSVKDVYETSSLLLDDTCWMRITFGSAESVVTFKVCTLGNARRFQVYRVHPRGEIFK